MKNTPYKDRSSNELEFAYKVRRALDERTAALPENTTHRLAQARKIALARKKPEARKTVFAPVRQLAGAFSDGFSNPFDHSLNWLGRVGIIIPLVVLLVGGVSIYQYEQQRHINELAEIDAAVLSDELPINAYLDHGFDSYLAKHNE